MSPPHRAGWSAPADLRAQVQRLWDRGSLLAGADASGGLFPLRLTLRSPEPRDFSERFDEARAWVQALHEGSTAGYRVVERDVRHRVLGANRMPGEVWVDSLDDALGLIARRREGRVFAQLLELTRTRQPVLAAWLLAHPLRALALQDDWSRLLEVVGWLQVHPRPGIYLRQVDLPGIHSKFIEAHRATLGQMLDLAMPAEAAISDAVLGAVENSGAGAGAGLGASAAADFARRYGFRAKSPRVRLRQLDPLRSLLGTGTDEDITIALETFAQLDPPCSQVFITENEINFLAFPAVTDAIVVFGAGYGFDALASAAWLHARQIHYWGDIDTHGFAILDQLRAHFGRTSSLLMDRDTLLGHRPLWTDEPEPVLRDLPRLREDERAVYDDLRWQRLEQGRRVRLEQERVGFRCVRTALLACGCQLA